jgi:excinuclease UvrABC ATPase subunit
VVAGARADDSRSRRDDGSAGREGDSRETVERPKSEPQAAAIAAAIGGLRKKGFARLLINGKAVAFDDVEAPQLSDRTMLQVVVDRVQVNGDDLRQRYDRLDRNRLPRGRRRGMGIEQSAVDSRQSSGVRSHRSVTTSPSASSPPMRYPYEIRSRACFVQ